MRLAFITGALAAGFAFAALVALIVWVATIVTGSVGPWSVAIWLVPIAGVVVAGATYVAEYDVLRRSRARARATGEPWAYRE